METKRKTDGGDSAMERQEKEAVAVASTAFVQGRFFYYVCGSFSVNVIEPWHANAYLRRPVTLAR